MGGSDVDTTKGKPKGKRGRGVLGAKVEIRNRSDVEGVLVAIVTGDEEGLKGLQVITFKA